LVEIPESHRAEAEQRRAELLEMASLANDEVAELILDEKPVSEELLKAALREGTLRSLFTPVVCGSSKNFHGVQQLLDHVIDLLPAPSDRPPVEGVIPRSKEKEKVLRSPDPKDHFSGLAFKTVSEPTGDLVYVRVYSGELHPSDTVLNTTNGRQERIGRMYRMMGNKREELEVAGPGIIVAVVGLKSTYTGNTLCSVDAPVALESINFPKPVISVALIPDKVNDESKLGDALGRLLRDDPTLKAHTDPETNQLIISGMGELHLEVSVDKLHRFPGVKVATGKPMVAYRQTLAKPIEMETRYIKQSGGRGKFAVITVKYKPLTKEELEVWQKKIEDEGEPADPNNIFFDENIFGGVVPKEYIPSVEQGIRESTLKGAKYGFPCVDIEAILVDGKIHPVDSSQDAFKLAGKENFRDAQERAGIILLEPIMKVAVVAPEKYMGSLTGDVSRRRGIIQETITANNRVTIMAQVPLAELFGYTTDLRGSTSGTASFTMEPSHYQEVKEELADLPAKK
jgi:elongation factor G